MKEAKEKGGFFSKVLAILSGKPEEFMTDPNQEENPFAPKPQDPVDLTFVKNFTLSGGKFLYCESEAEALSNIRNITQENKLGRIFCQEDALRSLLSEAGVREFPDSTAQCDAMCTSCEYLVAFNGGIMISSKQTGGKKLEDLPHLYIAVARTSQLVEKLGQGLSGIREKYKGNIPSQITTIKGPIKESANGEHQMSPAQKDIYLLLIEDQPA